MGVNAKNILANGQMFLIYGQMEKTYLKITILFKNFVWKNIWKESG